MLNNVEKPNSGGRSENRPMNLIIGLALMSNALQALGLEAGKKFQEPLFQLRERRMLFDAADFIAQGGLTTEPEDGLDTAEGIFVIEQLARAEIKNSSSDDKRKKELQERLKELNTDLDLAQTQLIAEHAKGNLQAAAQAGVRFNQCRLALYPDVAVGLIKAEKRRRKDLQEAENMGNL